MLRRLTVKVRADLPAAGRLCHRCGLLITGGPVYQMRRPGAARGVTWCATCAAPYLEVNR